LRKNHATSAPAEISNDCKIRAQDAKSSPKFKGLLAIAAAGAGPRSAAIRSGGECPFSNRLHLLMVVQPGQKHLSHADQTIRERTILNDC
jgi:hypothetical protein